VNVFLTSEEKISNDQTNFGQMTEAKFQKKKRHNNCLQFLDQKLINFCDIHSNGSSDIDKRNLWALSEVHFIH